MSIDWETGKSEVFDRMMFLHEIGAADMLNNDPKWDIGKWSPPEGTVKNPHKFNGAECLIARGRSWEIGGHPRYVCSRCGYVSWSDIAGECNGGAP